MVVGYRGIFSWTPIFLISFFGIGRHLLGKHHPLPGFHAMALVINIVVFVFYVVSRAATTQTLVLFAVSVCTTCHALAGKYGPWGMSWMHWMLKTIGWVSY